MWLVDYLCHDFSARGLSPWDMITSGLGHATQFRGSDTLPVIPAARYYYDEPHTEVCINSVNASEHSVSTTKIFTVGEQQMITDWLTLFPKGIFSLVSDTFDLWKLITEYLPANKDLIMGREGKLVIRPDSGVPEDIICGYYPTFGDGGSCEAKGVVELLWDIFGGTINEQGYKVLDPHIGVIYGDSITPERQLEIYQRLEAKGFAATNVVLGVGSYSYQLTSRDSLGFAAKGSWFEANGETYNIYKDPVTDDGTKRSLRGLLQVTQDDSGEYVVIQECTLQEEQKGLLQVIYEDGQFYNQTTLTKIRELCKTGI
jgi:nicotinamide phosphoribosyltransferase